MRWLNKTGGQCPFVWIYIWSPFRRSTWICAFWNSLKYKILTMFLYNLCNSGPWWLVGSWAALRFPPWVLSSVVAWGQTIQILIVGSETHASVVFFLFRRVGFVRVYDKAKRKNQRWSIEDELWTPHTFCDGRSPSFLLVFYIIRSLSNWSNLWIAWGQTIKILIHRVRNASTCRSCVCLFIYVEAKSNWLQHVAAIFFVCNILHLSRLASSCRFRLER